MSFLLDTNICSAHMRRPAALSHRFIQHMGRLAIPSLVLAELRAGARMKADPATLDARIDDLLVFLEVLDFDTACAESFGTVRGILHRQGIVVPPLDLLIAAVALAHNLTLVTNNRGAFRSHPRSSARRLVGLLSRHQGAGWRAMTHKCVWRRTKPENLGDSRGRSDNSRRKSRWY